MVKISLVMKYTIIGDGESILAGNSDFSLTKNYNLLWLFQGSIIKHRIFGGKFWQGFLDIPWQFKKIPDFTRFSNFCGDTIDLKKSGVMQRRIAK